MTMGRKDSPTQFRFKRFSVCHHRSSMKVGVDGVLIGCWADASGASRILDVGCGCGVVSLIMAQRFPRAGIVGIDIDTPSVEEASANAAQSPWPDRISFVHRDFAEFSSEARADECSRYDFIVSNPPFFDSGVTLISSRREQARHQGVLSPPSLLEGCRSLLNPGGDVAMVIPADQCQSVESHAEELGFALCRKCLVRGHPDVPFKRALLQWNLSPHHANPHEASHICPVHYLTLESPPGIPTDDYRILCHDFYLKF